MVVIDIPAIYSDLSEGAWGSLFYKSSKYYLMETEKN
jgi:hypothetical protein